MGIAFSMTLGRRVPRSKKRVRSLRNGDRLIATDVIAKRIVALAEEGKRDPDRLCARALSAIGMKSD